MNEPVVLKAGIADLDELVALERLAFEQESFTRRQLRYLLFSANADYVIIREKGKLAASLILLRRKGGNYLRVYSLLVSPKFRGFGFAKALLSYAQNQAQSAKRKGLSLEVSENNTAAVQLYIRFGFQTVAEKLKYYKDGSKALLMRKSV